MNPTTWTLEQIAAVAQAASGIAALLVSIVAAVVAFYAYKWHRQLARTEAQRRLTEDLRSWNELVLREDDLLDKESQNHPWGSLSREDIRRVYQYFILLNISTSLWDAHTRKAVETDTYESMINNLANTTFKDREFVKTHVLPRGYPQRFREVLVSRWAEIDHRGLLPPR